MQKPPTVDHTFKSFEKLLLQRLIPSPYIEHWNWCRLFGFAGHDNPHPWCFVLAKGQASMPT
jgi:hypothetical protein